MIYYHGFSINKGLGWRVAYFFREIYVKHFPVLLWKSWKFGRCFYFFFFFFTGNDVINVEVKRIALMMGYKMIMIITIIMMIDNDEIIIMMIVSTILIMMIMIIKG